MYSCKQHDYTPKQQCKFIIKDLKEQESNPKLFQDSATRSTARVIASASLQAHTNAEQSKQDLERNAAKDFFCSKTSKSLFSRFGDEA